MKVVQHGVDHFCRSGSGPQPGSLQGPWQVQLVAAQHTIQGAPECLCPYFSEARTYCQHCPVALMAKLCQLLPTLSYSEVMCSAQHMCVLMDRLLHACNVKSLATAMPRRSQAPCKLNTAMKCDRLHLREPVHTRIVQAYSAQAACNTNVWI